MSQQTLYTKTRTDELLDALVSILEGKASAQDVDDRFAVLIGTAPQSLDTLQEISSRFADDTDAAAALAALVSTKLDENEVNTLISAARSIIEANATATFVSPAATLSDAAAEWWTYPLTAFLPTPTPRTYFGGISATGEILVGSKDHLTGATVRKVLGTAGVDDHNAPGILVRAGRRTVVAWTNHNADNDVHMRVGQRGGGIDAFEVDSPTDFGSSLVSYTQLLPVPSLDTATTSTFWLGVRALVSGSWSWRFKKYVVNEIDGSLTSSASVQLVQTGTDQGYVSVAPFTNAASHEAVRCGVYDHPTNGTDHSIYYLEVDLVTGEVTSPGKTLTANIVTGVGLPLARTDLAKFVDCPSGSSTRLFAVRGGDLPPAIAYGIWGADGVVRYKTVEYDSDVNAGLSITATGHYASAAHAAAFITPDFSYREVLDPGTLTGATRYIARRWNGTGNNRVWQFYVNTTGNLALDYSTTGTATTATLVSTAALPAVAVGDTIGTRVDFIGNSGGSRDVKFYYSTDDGATWTQLGTTITGTAITLFAGSAALEVGSAGSTPLAGVVKNLSYRTMTDTVLASQDFVSGGWDTGETAGATDTDPQGNVWTLFGAATITVPFTTADFGLAGASVAPPGSTEANAKYVGGMCFTDPARDVVWLARETGGTWTVEKWAKESGTWAGTIRASSARKLWRPLPVQGGGPFDVVYTDSSSYISFESYAGDLVGLAAS